MPPSGMEGGLHCFFASDPDEKQGTCVYHLDGENGNLSSLRNENSNRSQEAGMVNSPFADGSVPRSPVLLQAPHFMMVLDKLEDAHRSG